MNKKTLIFLTIIYLTQIVNAQSIEFMDTKQDEIFIQIRCLDRTKSISFSVDTAAGIFGLGKNTYSTHTPEQLVRYGNMLEKESHYKITKGNKTISDPDSIVARLKHSEGARYKITFNDLKTCSDCKQRDKNKDNDYEEKMFQKGQLIQINLMETGKNFDNRKGWVIDNRSGIIKSLDGVNYVDPKKLGNSFSITCIDLNLSEADPAIKHDINPRRAFEQLDAFKIFAGGAYNKKEGDVIKINGDLCHRSFHTISSNASDASFELSPSEKSLDFFLASYGHGSPSTNRNYEYEFKVIDVAEGFTETFFASIIQFLADLNPLNPGYRYDYKYWPRKDHPAGPIPAGFRAITCKCNCCPGDPKYVVALAGTTIWSKSDWNSNILQGIPIENIPIVTSSNNPYESRVAPHYEYAIKYTSWVIDQYKLKNGGGLFSYPSAKNLTVSGHSLGGGLASYVSGYFSVPGFGYNPAPLASAAQVLMQGKRRPDKYFTNVRVPLDPVSGLLPLLPYQKLVGQIFTVESTGAWGSSFTVNDHMIGSIGNRVIGYKAPNSFENQKKNMTPIQTPSPSSLPTPTPSPKTSAK